jgi:hypothetical protein
MKEVNPWTWQDKLQFSQAIEVRGGSRVLYCAGQTSVDADGTPMHKGSMRAQRSSRPHPRWASVWRRDVANPQGLSSTSPASRFRT